MVKNFAQVIVRISIALLVLALLSRLMEHTAAARAGDDLALVASAVLLVAGLAVSRWFPQPRGRGEHRAGEGGL